MENYLPWDQIHKVVEGQAKAAFVEIAGRNVPWWAVKVRRIRVQCPGRLLVGWENAVLSQEATLSFII